MNKLELILLVHKLLTIHTIGFVIYAIIDMGISWEDGSEIKSFHFFRAFFWFFTMPFYIGIGIGRVNRFIINTTKDFH